MDDDPTWKWSGSKEITLATILLIVIIIVIVMAVWNYVTLRRRREEAAVRREVVLVARRAHAREERKKRHMEIQKALVSCTASDCECNFQSKFNVRRTFSTVTLLTENMSVVSCDAENLDIIESQEAGPTEEDVCLQMCPICLDEYVAGDSISWSKNQICRHVFHKSCIEGWLKQLDREGCCPCCRGPYLTKNERKKDENEQGVNHESLIFPSTSLDSSENDTEPNIIISQCNEVSYGVDKVIQLDEAMASDELTGKERKTESSYFCTVHGLMR
ncbi:hypothetical protein HJC23_004780 [Cyclotella cryptica]|uniref:RING-type domain-containing protein n=1 Tax=Cyclotella cryptica TaxID=29204 RepID=A0ABD3Q3K1_9STRA|eukprot:CCRYP_010404-RA/>CCRYP_010404-RA protein AED:0.04 eAED:0.04 QI:151/1/1/1/1/1/2/196/273